MAYTVTTPWQNETWCDSTYFNMYARLAARPLAGGSYTGSIPSFLTDVPRGLTLIVNGTTVTESRTPYQDDLADADWYVLGGSVSTVSNSQAQILIDAGYEDYVTPAVPSVTGLTEAAANTTLIASGFIKGVVTTSSEGATPTNTGKVKSQNPIADAALAQGGAVNLVLYLYA